VRYSRSSNSSTCADGIWPTEMTRRVLPVVSSDSSVAADTALHAPDQPDGAGQLLVRGRAADPARPPRRGCQWMFAQVRDAIASYPYPNTYVPGPGPTAIPSSRTSPGKSPTWRSSSRRMRSARISCRAAASSPGTERVWISGIALRPDRHPLRRWRRSRAEPAGLSLGVDPGQASTVAAGPRQARDGGPIDGSRRSL